MSYDLHCLFDINQHAKAYPYYTEVIIHPDGLIENAVPSHQMKLLDIFMKSKGITSRDEIENMCPREYWLDFNQWLMNETGCVSVWYDFCKLPDQGCTQLQCNALANLKAHNCYSGTVPI